MRLAIFICASLFAFLFAPRALAQTADDAPLALPAANWSTADPAALGPQRPNLNGASWAFSVAGDAYTLSGDRLRLPGAVQGWEDDIALGVGVFQALGE